MTGFGVFLLASGLPCLGLGIYFRNHPDRQESGGGDAKKAKKGGKKKGKGEGSGRKQVPEGGSLILGGAVCALAGVGLIVAGYLQ
ncbi:MAG: hypothetical protein AB7N76_33500 [Planctomycetota bacterium]